MLSIQKTVRICRSNFPGCNGRFQQALAWPAIQELDDLTPILDCKQVVAGCDSCMDIGLHLGAILPMLHANSVEMGSAGILW